MGDVQNLTVLWTDVERVTAEMERAVQAVSWTDSLSHGPVLLLVCG